MSIPALGITTAGAVAVAVSSLAGAGVGGGLGEVLESLIPRDELSKYRERLAQGGLVVLIEMDPKKIEVIRHHLAARYPAIEMQRACMGDD